jgi:lysyl-tRNA synthetase class II
MEAENPKATPEVLVGEDGVPLTKNQIKKLEKDRKKAEEKEAKAKKVADDKAKQALLEHVEIRNITSETDTYGELPLICSKTHNSKTFVEIGELGLNFENQDVLIRARLHNSRVKGPLAFLVLRKGMKTVQCIAAKSDTLPKEALKYFSGVPRESLVDVYGKVVKAPEEIKSCSQSLIEVQVTRIHVVSR